MSIPTIRLTEEKHSRSRRSAASQGASMNHLTDEFGNGRARTVRWRSPVRDARRPGDVSKGLTALDKVDRQFDSFGAREKRPTPARQKLTTNRTRIARHSRRVKP